MESCGGGIGPIKLDMNLDAMKSVEWKLDRFESLSGRQNFYHRIAASLTDDQFESDRLVPCFDGIVPENGFVTRVANHWLPRRVKWRSKA